MKIKENVKLAPFTTFKVGGKAKYYCSPKKVEDIKNAITFASKNIIEMFFLGGGSNVLISDEGYDGIIIHLKNFNTVIFKNDIIETQAGANVSKLALIAAKNSLSGMEFAGGLPGSIGGAVYMNAKAYDHSFSEIVESVKTIDINGVVHEYTNEQLDYSYKFSNLMKKKEIITSIRLALKKGNKDTIIKDTKNNHAKRASAGQFIYPNAGCIFKNNYTVGIPSGKIIDDLGLIGTKVGNAAIYEKHGNFIINRGNAKAADIKKLISIIKEKVYKTKNIKLEEEIRYLGF